VVFLKGDLELLSVLDLDVSGYILLSANVVSLEVNFSAAGNFLNLASASASGTLFLSSEGEFLVDVHGDVQLGPDGNLWFTEEDVNQIGRITPQGVIREFIPPSCCFPTGITAGQDGRMWFTLEIGDQIGRVEPNGTMTMFTIPSVQVLPWDITPGLDGGLWFTELSGRAVGTISTAGSGKSSSVKASS